MMHLDAPEAQAILSKITHIYTDLDGTLLAPGGRLLATHHGKPSTTLAKALVRLKRAGVEVIIVTGRDAISCTEIMRLTNLEQFIAEMGCVAQSGYGPTADKHYILGEWTTEHFDQDYDHIKDLTPFEMIKKSGALDALLNAFKGKLEVHTLKESRREVTYLMRGCVDTSPGGAVEQVLSTFELPLQLLDNGVIHPPNHGLLDVDEIHVYHLMPRGTGKGQAVAQDMQAKGLAPSQTISIGDAEGDVAMGLATGSFVLVNNHKKTGPETYAAELLGNKGPLFTTTLSTADGWVEFAHAVLEAKDKAGD